MKSSTAILVLAIFCFLILLISIGANLPNNPEEETPQNRTILSVPELPTNQTVPPISDNITITPDLNETESTMSEYCGIASRPTTDGSDTDYKTIVVQQVIDFMNLKGLNIYRMCFHVGVNVALRNQCIQYFLDNCSHTLIVNYYHDGFGTAMSDAEWTTSTAKALALLAVFSGYQDRLWIEPANERTNTDLATHIQTFITDIRTAGYTCNIIVNRWYTQTWASYDAIVDPLDKFWTGEHHYFNMETLSWAETKEQQAIILGLHLLDTEVGADTREYPYFTTTKVNATSDYLDWCNTYGTNACVWMLHGIRNWTPKSSHTSYSELGLEFPGLLVKTKSFSMDTYPRIEPTINFTMDTYPTIATPPTSNYEFVMNTWPIAGNAKTFSMDSYPRFKIAPPAPPIFSLTFPSVIAELEKYSGIECLFETGVAVPGLDNFKCPMRTAIKKVET